MIGRLSPLVAAIPHPDDEVFFAGLLARAAREGARVEIVCATRGEAGPAPRDCRAPGALAARRAVELEASCRALGAAPPEFLDLPDGGLGDLEVSEIAEILAGALRARAPRAVVSFGDDGGYGHRDHVAIARALPAAAAAVPAPPAVLAAAFPRGALAPAARALARFAPGLLDARVDPELLGEDRGAADLIVDVTSVAGVKRAAAAAHRSQLPGGDPDRFLAAGVLSRLSEEEWYLERAAPTPGGARR